LRFRDFRADGDNPPRPRSLLSWSLSFTSRLTTGTDRTVFTATPTTGESAGAFDNTFSNKAVVSPDVGIGPHPQLAYDNPLGAFSPFQGRLYLAFTGGGGSNTDVFVVASDDGGTNWGRLSDPVSRSARIRVNDDVAFIRTISGGSASVPADNFSEGVRSQF